MKNKKILWIINQYSNIPEFPGHTRQYELSIGLSSKKWEVEVFSSDFNLNERKFKRLKGFKLFLVEKIKNVTWNWVKVFPYKKNNYLRYLNLISFCLNLLLILNLKTLRGKLIKKMPNIIIASSPQLPAAFFTFLFAKLFRIKFVLEVRDLWPQVLIDSNNNNNFLIIKTLVFMEKILYKYSELIIVLTKGAKKYIKNKGGKNIICLPNGPDINQFKFQDLPFENNMFNDKRKFLILYSGAHGKVNGLMNVLESASLIKGYPIEFHFVGDGTEKENLIAASRKMNNIKFFDPVPKYQMPKLIAKYDAILLSLEKINLFKYGVSPNKLYDAYAIGRPVISTVEGEINREIADLNLGTTSKPNDPVNLANAIKSLFKKTRNEREEMGKNARKCAEKYYSRDLIIRKLNRSLSKIISN